VVDPTVSRSTVRNPVRTSAPKHSTASPEPGGAVVIREEQFGDLPLYVNPQWRARFPWLFQATTGAGLARNFDLSFFGASPGGQVQERWRAIQRATGFETVIHSRQVHEARVLVHDRETGSIVIHGDADGHITRASGQLLAVSIADCVPVFLVSPQEKAIALLHAGWRGVVAGILEWGVDALLRVAGWSSGDLHLYLGPAICGNCYEVGPEVHEQLGLPRPFSKAPVDLRFVLQQRALRLGLRPENVSQSEYCSRCGGGVFFSHRGGQRERQMALLGIKSE
jgi:polyphenol oxidase